MADTFWVDSNNIAWIDGDVDWIGDRKLLAIQGSTHSHSADAIAITQKHTLVVADSTQSHSVDNATVVLHIIAADSSHNHSADNITITQAHALSVNDSTHSQSVDGITIVVDLVISDTTHAVYTSNFAITQAHTLVSNDSSHAHSVDSVAVTQKQHLIPNAADHTILSNVVSITHYRTYTVNGIQEGLVQEVKDLIQDTTYGYAEILGWLNEAQLLVSGGVLMVYPDKTQAFSSPLESLETTATVDATTTATYVSLPSDYQRGLFYIYNETADCFVNLAEAFGLMLVNSPSLDEDKHVTDAVIEGRKLYYQGIPDEDETLRLYYYRKPHDMATYTSSGISFSGTTIADSNNGLGVFYAGQIIDITGNYANSGEHTIVSVEDDGSEMVVTDSSTTEAAGSSITIRSRPEIPEHLQKPLLVNRAIMKYLQIKHSEFSQEYQAKFYNAMIDLETDRENVNVPKLWRAA